ncbi:hypothetical protein DMUE_4093 [Dictyocoela muelleri]|nr:hypothetical protein DMUE_4093 [Dictyocoela muelleri]
MKYDLNFLTLQQSKLNRIKQIKYKKIIEFYEEIKKITNEIGICKKWSTFETQVLLESKFIENLSFETRIKMAEMSRHSVDEIINYITNIENVILTDSKFYKTQNKRECLNRNNENYKFKNQDKFCKYHNS